MAAALPAHSEQRVKAKQDDVQQDEDGNYFIPASQRPDGTWRKARRVKAGYVPQEEQPTYVTKGVAWMKRRPQHPVGLAPDDVARHTAAVRAAAQPRTNADAMSAAAASNRDVMRGLPPGLSVGDVTDGSGGDLSKSAKRRAKQKAKKEGGGGGQAVDALGKKLQGAKIVGGPGGDGTSTKTEKATVAGGNDVEAMGRKVKALRKKLRQIEDLEQKVDAGEVVPDAEQQAKIARKPEVAREIEDLEIEIAEKS